MRAASPIAERPISQTGTLFCHKLFSFAIWLIVENKLEKKKKNPAKALWEKGYPTVILFEWCFVYQKNFLFYTF